MSDLRRRPVLWVVIAGVLVSIGTGDYDPPTRRDEAGLALLPGQAITVRVSANQDALVVQGDFYAEMMATSASLVDTTLRVVPENFEAQATELVLKSKGPSEPAAAGAGSLVGDDGGADEDAGSPAAGASGPQVVFETTILGLDWRTCPTTGLCERTFRVERIDGPGDSGHAVNLTVNAVMSEQEPGGGVFCSSPVPKFGKNAEVTVHIDE